MTDKKTLRAAQNELAWFAEQEEALTGELESLKTRLQELQNTKKLKEAELKELERQMALDEERKREEQARKKYQETKVAWREKWADRIRDNGFAFLRTLAEAVADGNKAGLSETDMLTLLRPVLDELNKVKWQNNLLNFYF